MGNTFAALVLAVLLAGGSAAGGERMYELSVKTRFSAAHHIRGYEGSCAEVHGHNWDVEVFVRGRTLGATGLLVDFRDLKQAVREVLEAVDHKNLNAIEDFRAGNPTSENIARYLFGKLAARIDGAGHRVHRVTVNETPESKATYWEDE